MSCDIHCYAEIFKENTWQKVGNNFTSSMYRDEDKYFSKDEFKHTDEPIDQRNYSLFAVLSDVRNYPNKTWGTKGDPFVPISQPKGLPTDVSKEVFEESESWGKDGHSHSYLTLEELLDYDYTKQRISRGIVDVDQYKLFKEKGKPTSCRSAVGGGQVKIVSNAEIELLTDAELKDWDYYTEVAWRESYKEAIGDYFFDYTIPSLERCGAVDKVRIVFWFDN